MRIAVIGDSPRDEALRTQLRRMGNEVSDSEADADVVVALSSDATTAPGRTPVVVRGDVNVPSFPPGVEAQAWAVLRACEDAVEARPVKRDAPRVGLWGTFDVENFGDLLFPRIFELELRRRILVAETSNRSLVSALSQLGNDLDLVELQQVSASASLAASAGAPVAKSLAAKCATLRSALSAEQETDARVRTGKITVPLVGMSLLIMAAVVYPALNFSR